MKKKPKVIIVGTPMRDSLMHKMMMDMHQKGIAMVQVKSIDEIKEDGTRGHVITHKVIDDWTKDLEDE